MNFHSYCLVQYKRGPLQPLFDRVSRICTVDTLEKYLIISTCTLVRNVYPRNFRNRKKSKVITRCDALHTVQKKSVFITLLFKGDLLTFTMKQHLENFIERTYYVAALFLLSKTEPIYVHNFGRINNDAVTSHCIYQFTFHYGSNYIGRTERMLKTRVKEHIPNWLQNQFDTPHRIDGNGDTQNHRLLNILSRQVIWGILPIHSKWSTRTEAGRCYDLL